MVRTTISATEADGLESVRLPPRLAAKINARASALPEDGMERLS
jgi:hypothetical protein